MFSCYFNENITPSYSWSVSKEGYFIFGGAYLHSQCAARFQQQKAALQNIGFAFDKALKRECCLVLYPKRFKDFVCGKNHIFLVGEAAGFVSFSTLEGISGAMRSSEILSEILNRNEPNAHNAYAKATRFLVFKTLFRAYAHYPFMFVPWIRRIILKCGILRIKKGMDKGVDSIIQIRHPLVYRAFSRTFFTASTMFFRLGLTSSHLRVFSPQSGLIHSCSLGKTSKSAWICASISSTLGILGL